MSPPQRLKSHTDLKVCPCCYQINQSQSQGECGRKLQTVKKYMYIVYTFIALCQFSWACNN